MHSRDVSAIDTRPPRCCSWLHSCFAKYFTQTALAAAAPAGGNRGDAERRQRTRAAPSPRPRPLTAAVGFTAIPSAPGMRWLPWCRSQTPGWGSRPDGFVQDPPITVSPTGAVPPLSGTARPARLSCWWSHEVAPAPRPHGDSQPLGRANPSFPLCL